MAKDNIKITKSPTKLSRRAKRRKTQRIIIYYKFIGAIDIPAGSKYERLRRETRQGVEVEYITQTKSA